MNPERVVAAFFALLCLVFLVRLLVGKSYRDRIDQLFERTVQASKMPWGGIKRWHIYRQGYKAALKQAREAINHARITSTERHGNVYSPKAFKKKRHHEQAKDQPLGPDTKPKH